MVAKDLDTAAAVSEFTFDGSFRQLTHVFHRDVNLRTQTHSDRCVCMLDRRARACARARTRANEHPPMPTHTQTLGYLDPSTVILKRVACYGFEVLKLLLSRLARSTEAEG